VEPVVDYINSMAHMNADQSARFRRFVASKLAECDGALSVTKESGLFKAW
jgi:hypothetical protein